MGIDPQTRDGIVDMKDAMTDGGPIDIKTRDVQFHNGYSANINLTAMGRDVLDISDGDTCKIEIYRSGIWIEPEQ